MTDLFFKSFYGNGGKGKTGLLRHRDTSCREKIGIKKGDRVFCKGIDEYPLRIAVLVVVSAVFGVTFRDAETSPVCRPVAGPLVTGKINEGFGEKDGVAVNLPVVPGESPRVKGKNPRGEILLGNPRQYKKTHVVGDIDQPSELSLRPPSDVLIAN